VSRAADVVVVQTNLPDYRAGFFELLCRRLDSRLLLLSGEDDFAAHVQPLTSVPYGRTRNRFLAGRRLMWQSGVVWPVLRARVAVLIINPRLLSVWAALLLRKMLGRRTVLWGHAWPRRGRGTRSDHVRHIMRRLADTLIVYTETEAAELRACMPGADVVAAPNALYSLADLARADPSGRRRDFLCVGRLVPEKKPGLLLSAFLLARDRLPADVRLVFVGDGPLHDELVAGAKGAADRIVFEGHVSELEKLAPAYADALATVSPGYVGLSLTQSLCFGVPMLIGRQEPHSPEIEAAVEGQNACFFESDSPEALASLLVSVFQQRDDWVARRRSIAEVARRAYTVEAMVERFISALRLNERGAPSSPRLRL
jgi:glycosyltransferase involved in cell wall biosynthesis